MNRETTNQDQSEKKRRSWARWLILGTGIVATLFAVCGGVLVWMIWGQWDRRTAIQTFFDRGVSYVFFDPRVPMRIFNWVDERYPASTAMVGSMYRIRIYGSEFSNAEMALLRHFPELRHLNLINGRVTEKGLVHLEELQQLQSLTLDYMMRDESLEHVNGIKSLRVLDLTETRITGAGLAYVEDLTNLRRLILKDTQVTDDGLAHLKKLTNLESLHLNRTQVTGSGLASLRDLKNLEILSLWQTQLNDANVMHLSGFPKLRELDISGTRVTDAGLKHLKDLPSLVRLGVYPGQVTRQAMEELKERAPRLQIPRYLR